MNPLCNCLSLRQATKRVTQLYDQALAPVGLRATQFSLLRAATLVDARDTDRPKKRPEPVSSGGPATQARRSYPDFCRRRDCRRSGRNEPVSARRFSRHRPERSPSRYPDKRSHWLRGANKAPVQAKDPK